MAENNGAALTKADFFGFMAQFRIEIREQFKESEARLRADLASKADLERFATKDDLIQFKKEIAIPISRLEGQVHKILHVLATEVSLKTEIKRVMDFADFCVKELDEHRDLRSTRGHILGQVADTVADHEFRIRRLEPNP